MRIYTVFMMSFQSLWSFTIASRSRDPVEFSEDEFRKVVSKRSLNLKFFYPDYLRRMYTLPYYLVEDLKKPGIISTDEKPFIWEKG